MKHKQIFLSCSILLLVLVGCSDNKEEKAFRASLIDKALNDETSKAGKLFLENNKLAKDVVVLESGLQYKVLSSGERTDKNASKDITPKITDTVKIKYEGRLISGEVFDSSAARKLASKFPINSVIRGWREALLQMKINDKWRIYIPPHLAYSARSPSALIAANSTLIFDIELVEIIQQDGQSIDEKSE